MKIRNLRQPKQWSSRSVTACCARKVVRNLLTKILAINLAHRVGAELFVRELTHEVVLPPSEAVLGLIVDRSQDWHAGLTGNLTIGSKTANFRETHRGAIELSVAGMNNRDQAINA